MKTISLCLYFICCCTMAIKSQNNTASGGGNAIGSGGFSSYSIGQIVYTSNNGVNGSVIQGSQQPYDISVVTSIKETSLSIFLSVFPNPTKDFLTLHVEKNQNLAYQLVDLNGKLLESKSLTQNDTNISMADYSIAIYFLKVTQNNVEIKTFKIIKN